MKTAAADISDEESESTASLRTTPSGSFSTARSGVSSGSGQRSASGRRGGTPRNSPAAERTLTPRRAGQTTSRRADERPRPEPVEDREPSTPRKSQKSASKTRGGGSTPRRGATPRARDFDGGFTFTGTIPIGAAYPRTEYGDVNPMQWAADIDSYLAAGGYDGRHDAAIVKGRGSPYSERANSAKQAKLHLKATSPGRVAAELHEKYQHLLASRSTPQLGTQDDRLHLGEWACHYAILDPTLKGSPQRRHHPDNWEEAHLFRCRQVGPEKEMFPKGMKPIRSVPGYTGFIPEKHSEGIYGCSYGRANGLVAHARFQGREADGENLPHAEGYVDDDQYEMTFSKATLPGYSGHIPRRRDEVLGKTHGDGVTEATDLWDEMRRKNPSPAKPRKHDGSNVMKKGWYGNAPHHSVAFEKPTDRVIIPGHRHKPGYGMDDAPKRDGNIHRFDCHLARLKHPEYN